MYSPVSDNYSKMTEPLPTPQTEPRKHRHYTPCLADGNRTLRTPSIHPPIHPFIHPQDLPGYVYIRSRPILKNQNSLTLPIPINLLHPPPSKNPQNPIPPPIRCTEKWRSGTRWPRNPFPISTELQIVVDDVGERHRHSRGG